MSRIIPLLILVFLQWAGLPAVASTAGEADELQKMASPLDEPSPEIDATVVHLRRVLQGLNLSPPPVAASALRLIEKPDQPRVLIGDFAKDGSMYALVELASSEGDNTPADSRSTPAGIAFARWQTDHWELRGAWTINPIWRPAGWKSTGDDYLPAAPAEKPFWTEKLEGDCAPWIVVAGGVNKYYQSDYVFRFDAAQGRLQLLELTRDKPCFLPGGWLRLYSNSGRRSIWEEWSFERWKSGKLMTRASWHSEVPYNNVDPPFVNVERYVAEGSLQDSYVIKDGDEGDDHTDSVAIAHGKRYFATVIFWWRHTIIEEQEAGNYVDGMEKAYLFEKLTGLPRSFFPEQAGLADGKPLPKLESEAQVRVRGGAEAVLRLKTP